MAVYKRVKRYKRSSNESKRPALPFWLLIVGFCAASLIVLGVFIVIAVQTAGDTPNVMGGTGVLLMVAAIALAVLGVTRVKNNTYSMVSRVLALVAPIIAGLSWLYIYITGVVWG